MLEMNETELMHDTILFNHEIRFLENKTVPDLLKKSDVL
jgi:hypothetical protein